MHKGFMHSQYILTDHLKIHNFQSSLKYKETVWMPNKTHLTSQLLISNTAKPLKLGTLDTIHVCELWVKMSGWLWYSKGLQQWDIHCTNTVELQHNMPSYTEDSQIMQLWSCPPVWLHMFYNTQISMKHSDCTKRMYCNIPCNSVLIQRVKSIVCHK
jgi:hypothetical protein